MFLENKYTLWYYNIINKARSITRAPGCYVERHHIVPKSLGGLNNKSNLVYLSAKEHFICHLLLVKMTEGKERRSMWYAAYRMCHKDNEYIPGARVYQMLKQRMVQANKERPGPNLGKIMSDEQKKKISNSTKGIPRGPFSDEHRNNMRKPKSAEHKESLSKSKTGKSWGTHSEQTKIKMSEWQKGVKKEKVSCEFCSKEISLLNYTRWHGAKCKQAS
jgi:hypothetical protein